MAYAEGEGYFSNMGRDLVRGVKNVISSPVEIPYTMDRYGEDHRGSNSFWPIAGFFHGAFNMVTRCGSGIWDLGFAFIPGQQEGLPPDPETFF